MSAYSLSGDCDSTCYFSNDNYSVNITEGVLTAFNYSSVNSTHQWIYPTADMGILFTDTAVMSGTITGTSCTNTTIGEALNVYCSNSDASNNWSFYDGYIMLISNVPADTYRLYAYYANPQDGTVSTWNGTDQRTSATGWYDWDSSIGVHALSFDYNDQILINSWNESLETDFNYYDDRTPGDATIGVSLARSSEITANNSMRQYLRVYNKNSSETGDAQYTSIIDCFKADPNATCLYTPPVTPEELHLSTRFVNNTDFSASWGEIWAFVSEDATSVSYQIDSGSNVSMTRYDNDWTSWANNLNNGYNYGTNDYSYAPQTNTTYWTSTDVAGEYDEYGSCIVNNGFVICASKKYDAYDGHTNFTKLNASTGVVNWTFDMLGDGDSTPQVDSADDNVIWVSTNNATGATFTGFYKLNMSSNTQICNFSDTFSNNGFVTGFEQDDDYIYDCSTSGVNCYRIAKTDCSVDWNVSITGIDAGAGQPFVWEDYVVFVFHDTGGGSENTIQVMWKSNGSLVWGNRNADSYWDGQCRVLSDDGDLWCLSQESDETNNITAYNITNGNIIWTEEQAQRFHSKMTKYGEYITYSARTTRNVSVRNYTDPTHPLICSFIVPQQADVDEKLYHEPICAGTTCYVASNDNSAGNQGVVYAFNITDCSPTWNYTSSSIGFWNPPSITDGVLYIKADGTGDLYAFGEEMRPTWYANMTGTSDAHTVTIWASNASIVNSTTFYFNLHFEPGLINYTHPYNGSSYYDYEWMNFSMIYLDNDSSSASCSLYINGSLNVTNASVQNNTAWTTNVSMSYGYYNYNFTCDDGNNTENSGEKTFTLAETVVNNAPTAYAHYPTNGSTIYDQEYSLINCSFIDSDNATATLRMYLNGSLTASNSSAQNNTQWVYNATGIGYAEHNYTCEADDGINTSNSSTLTFTLAETPAPVGGDGGVSYWNYNSTIDEWSGYNATAYSVTSITEYPLFNISGDSMPTAYRFDGTDDNITVNDPEGLDFGTGNFSASIWVRHNTTLTGQAGMMFSKGAYGVQNGYSAYFNSGETYFATCDAACTVLNAGNTPSINNTWSHYVFIRNGTNMSFYHNGSLYASTSGTLRDVNNSYNFTVGYAQGGAATYFLEGDVDEVKIYNYTLSLEEIINLYNYGDEEGESGGYFTVTVIDAWNASDVDNINITVNGTTYTNATGNTVTTNINKTADSGTLYDIIVIGYNRPSRTYEDYNISSDLIAELYPPNSINVTFKYANDTIIIGTTINVTIINSIEAQIDSTTDGYITFNPLIPDNYEIRSEADGFLDRRYFFTMTNSTTQNITVYLTLNATNATTELQVFRVQDTSGEYVEGGTLRIEKETTSGSSLWTNYAEEITNAQGKSNAYLEKGINEWYRFSVIVDGTVKKLFPSEAYVSSKTNFISGVSETIELVIITEETSLLDYYDELYGVAYEMVWIDNDTISFYYTDGQNSISGGRLLIKGKYTDNTTEYETISNDISSSTSDNLTYIFTPINNTVYQIEAYITYDDHEVLVAFDTKVYGIDSSVEKNFGLLIAVVLIAIMAFLTIKVSNNKKSLMVSLIMSFCVLLVTNLLLFTSIPVTIITSLIALVIIFFASFKGGND